MPVRFDVGPYPAFMHQVRIPLSYFVHPFFVVLFIFVYILCAQVCRIEGLFFGSWRCVSVFGVGWFRSTENIKMTGSL